MTRTATRRPQTRLNIIVRPGDKRLAMRLAHQEQVSTSEIIRRSLHQYGAKAGLEESEMKSAISQMNDALDKALLAVRSARQEVASNIAAMRKLRAEHR